MNRHYQTPIECVIEQHREEMAELARNAKTPAQRPAKPSDAETFINLFLEDFEYMIDEETGIIPKSVFSKVVEAVQENFKCSNDRAILLSNQTIQKMNLTKEI